MGKKFRDFLPRPGLNPARSIPRAAVVGRGPQAFTARQEAWMDKLTPGGRSGAQPQRMQQMQQMQGPPTAVSGGGQQMAWNGNRWMEQQPNAQPMYERGMRPDGPAYDTYQPQPYRAPVSAGNRFAPIGSGGGMVPGPRQGLPAPVQSYAPQSDMVRAVGVPTTNRSAKIAG